ARAPRAGRARAANARRRSTRPSWRRSRQGFQYVAEPADRLAHMQPLLDLPYPRRDRMHYRNLQVLLERLDDVERAPARAQHVDRVGALVLEEVPLDETVDLLARELLHLVERHLD